VNAQDLLLAIQELLDGVEWTPDTLEAIAALMIKGGYQIRDMHDDQPLVIEPAKNWDWADLDWTKGRE
jgi:putative SOS response-associated peptidase YedK